MSLQKDVLRILYNNQGQWMTEASLSRILRVPAEMIGDLIQGLCTDGYQVEKSLDKGYRLINQDSLLPEEVSRGLMSDIFGRKGYFYYPEIDSTNNRALELAAEGYPEGTVVVAETQTAGRGRRGRTWHSPARHGIYLSVILRPPLPVREVPRVSLLVGVAVAETLEAEYDLPARVKWPNDILVNHRKIAGILSEVVTSPQQGVDYIVTGIGLNINNPLEDFPPDLRTDPTSVMAERDTPVSRVRILQGLLMRLESRYYQLLAGDWGGILKKGKDLSMVLGQEIKFDTPGGLAAGRAVDIDNDGFLLVQDEKGKTHTVMSGEVYISPPEHD
ncbi:MAG: biotin--[acetyl-CoA-carboxylase] ligase [Syntrophomonadales bacterium]